MLLKDLYLIFISSVIMILMVLVSVAFFTLMERKGLGYMHNRKGPVKVGYLGLMQPFSDAIKLFSKEQNFPYMSNLNIFYLAPVFNLFLSLMLWISMPFFTVNLNFNLSFMYMLCISSMGVYCIMMSGWSSNSNYAMLGSMRSVAQSISYEVSLILILMCILLLINSFNYIELMKFQEFIYFLFFMMPMFLMWMVTSLAETNRTPFDFAEGESELVSGFNVEYSSGSFAMIFLSEYSSILFMSMITILLFFGGELYSFMFFCKIVVMAYLWVWVRGSLPRYRYDKLMYLAWKIYLPVSLFMLMFYFGMKIFLDYII